jgi:enoyl-CoA hydratase/carnithine racemase
MSAQWQQDLEAFEAINQDEAVRQVVLRMAGLARGGQLGTFMDAVRCDDDLDAETKDTVLELASEPTFLLAAEEYLRSCKRYH